MIILGIYSSVIVAAATLSMIGNNLQPSRRKNLIAAVLFLLPALIYDVLTLIR